MDCLYVKLGHQQQNPNCKRLSNDITILDVIAAALTLVGLTPSMHTLLTRGSGGIQKLVLVGLWPRS